MAEYLFDTNIVAERSFAALPQRSYVSAVVLTELMTDGDADEFKIYQVTWQRQAQAAWRIVPAMAALLIIRIAMADRWLVSSHRSMKRSSRTMCCQAMCSSIKCCAQ